MVLNFKELPKRYSIALALIIIGNAIIFIASIVLIIVSTTGDNDLNCADPSASLFTRDKITIRDERAVFDTNTKEFELRRARPKGTVLKGHLGIKIDNEYLKDISISKKAGNEMEVKFTSKLPEYLVSSSVLRISTQTIKTSSYEINCDRHDWSFEKRLEDQNQEFEDCFKLTGGYWYGGAESYLEQFWPINNQTHKYDPYLTGLFGTSSSVLERYWLSSNGVAIVVNQSIPLFVSMNKTDMCLLSSTKYPYSKKQIMKLSYDVCTIDHEANDGGFLRDLHLQMIQRYFATPIGIPDQLMFKSPIWSTWATYKRDINQSVVLDFAKEIKDNQYPNCQLEIDDRWAPAYGDFVFDTKKFPNATQMIQEIKALGYRVTLWTHPFANVDSATFLDKAFKFYWVRAPDGLHPAFTAWWNGPAAGILDTTYPDATEWFHQELTQMRETYGIDSFKFDAGETEWLPKLGFWLYNDTISPDQYSIDYARMAARTNTMIEVRTGCQTQDLPIFVRMLDKDSRWGFDNGLKSVVTTGLVMSILGYPFLLPDMIGGNAYGVTNDTDGFNADLSVTVYPDYELYVRWAQVTAFMPSMQFSIPPWHYNNKTTVPVNEICRKAVQIHEELVYPVLLAAAKMSVESGIPIMRPLWWIDATDQNNLVIYDEFLVGDSLLVAPILDEGAVKRDIYLPKGTWKDGNNETIVYQGPRWLRDYPAPIDVIPFFKSA